MLIMDEGGGPQWASSGGEFRLTSLKSINSAKSPKLPQSLPPQTTNAPPPTTKPPPPPQKSQPWQYLPRVLNLGIIFASRGPRELILGSKWGRIQFPNPVLPSRKSDQEISKSDFYQTLFLPKFRPKADPISLFRGQNQTCSQKLLPTLCGRLKNWKSDFFYFNDKNQTFQAKRGPI